MKTQVNPKQDHHLKTTSTNETRKGKILLQPPFTQQNQQQTQHIKTNSTTQQHDKQSLTTRRKRTSTMAGLPISTNFSRLQKDNKPRRRRRATSTFFQHSIQS